MRNLALKNLATLLLLTVISISIWRPAFAEEMTCPEHTPVVIDIKPGSDPNTINLSSKGLVAVAVLTTPTFDASLFSPVMAHLMDASTHSEGSCEGVEPVRWAYSDVNKDGKLDLVFFFRTQDLNFTFTTTAATFMAHGDYDGTTTHIMGTDTVIVIIK